VAEKERELEDTKVQLKQMSLANQRLSQDNATFMVG
jgi:hypothetical protein